MKIKCAWVAPLGLLFTLFGAQARGQGVYTRPPLPGTMDVTQIDTMALLNIMSNGNAGFIPVAAHRGFWRELPESSTLAIAAAYNAGVEAVEIDVRYASTSLDPFSDPNASLVLSHDECVNRQTTGTGSLRYNASSKCDGGGLGMSGAAYTGLFLRDRRGAVTASQPPTFAQALQVLGTYLSIATGKLTGPILIVDMKDRDIIPGNYDAWKEYKVCLSIMQTVLPQEDWPAVLFKLKMDSQPSPAVMSTEWALHPAYGHMIQTIVPEDISIRAYAPSGTSDTLFNPPFCSFTGPCLLGMTDYIPPAIQQFELVPYNANDGTSAYQGGPNLLTSFATYYQPSSLPEGVTDRYSHCCVLAPLLISETPEKDIKKTDIRGVLDFATNYQQVSMITSDNLLETLNYLVTLGARNTSLILSTTESSPPPGDGGSAQ